MYRHRLTDEQWRLIKGVFPKPAATGRPPRDRRQVVDGILWILRTGSPWRDLPDVFGPYQTVWHLFNQWNDDGTLEAILKGLRGRVKINREVWCIDGAVVRGGEVRSGRGKKTIHKSRATTRWAVVEAA